MSEVIVTDGSATVNATHWKKPNDHLFGVELWTNDVGSTERKYEGGFLVFDRLLGLESGCTLQAAAIGLVWVPKVLRGEGRASRFLSEGLELLKRRWRSKAFAVAILISGDRTLYSRQRFKVLKPRVKRNREHLWGRPLVDGIDLLATQKWFFLPKEFF